MHANKYIDTKHFLNLGRLKDRGTYDARTQTQDTAKSKKLEYGDTVSNILSVLTLQESGPQRVVIGRFVVSDWIVCGKFKRLVLP